MKAASPGSAPGGAAIPQIVHRLWLGDPEPEWSRRLANTWSRPGWEIRLWTDANVPSLFPLRNQAIFDAAEEIAPNHVGQLRADVLRYELLWRFGGVWVDADLESLRPLGSLLEGVECFAAREDEHWIGNTILGAVPGHPFLGALIEHLPANVEANRGAKPNRLTGPQYLTRIWRVTGQGITVFARELFFPFSYRDVEEFVPGSVNPAERWPDAYTCHWWANRRRERGLTC